MRPLIAYADGQLDMQHAVQHADIPLPWSAHMVFIPQPTSVAFIHIWQN